ncbi:hypothetical protein QTO34_016345 [Cnephaeus nilssonii]|uniref:Uncharacterized protein n=1 Tax=Cnephaeus nilssonii TaxID=3371016 RepID=A0AA40I6S0_CNENI|nr:hypothetical protein QTO34_016345 [Eptesicus nilssonii]
MAMAAAGGKQRRDPARFVYVPRFGSHQCSGVLQLGGRRAGELRGAAGARGEGELSPGSEPGGPAASSGARASSARSRRSAARAGGGRGRGGRGGCPGPGAVPPAAVPGVGVAGCQPSGPPCPLLAGRSDPGQSAPSVACPSSWCRERR